MRLQVTLRLFLLALMLAKVKTKQYLHSHPHLPHPPLPPPNYCLECEEEVWEEIPCEDVESTTPIPTTFPPTPTTITTTTLPPSTTTLSTTTTAATTRTTPTTTTPSPSTVTTTTASPSPPSTRYKKPYSPVPPTRKSRIYSAKRYPVTPSRKPITLPTTVAPTTTPSIESSDTYKKCYCECKSGCKEFCRKVVVHSDDKKQITQLSRTIQPLPNGQVEVKHLLERNWIPSIPAYSPNNIPIPPLSFYQHSKQLLEHPSSQLPQLTLPEYVQGNAAPAAPNYIAAPYDSANYQHHDVEADSLGFTIDELTKLLNSEHNYNNAPPRVSHPHPQSPNEYTNSYAGPLLPTFQAENSYHYTAPTAALPPITKNYEQPQELNPYLNVEAAIPQGLPTQQFQNPPFVQQYAENNPSENHIPAEENYLQDLIYSHPPNARGHGYSLSF